MISYPSTCMQWQPQINKKNGRSLDQTDIIDDIAFIRVGEVFYVTDILDVPNSTHINDSDIIKVICVSDVIVVIEFRCQPEILCVGETKVPLCLCGGDKHKRSAKKASDLVTVYTSK